MIMLMMVVILMLEPRFGIRVKGGVPFEVLYFFFFLIPISKCTLLVKLVRNEHQRG